MQNTRPFTHSLFNKKLQHIVAYRKRVNTLPDLLLIAPPSANWLKLHFQQQLFKLFIAAAPHRLVYLDTEMLDICNYIRNVNNDHLFACHVKPYVEMVGFPL